LLCVTVKILKILQSSFAQFWPKKPEILDAAVEDNILKQKVHLQNNQGIQPDNSGVQAF
jgi:hypothetical protein